MSLTGSFGIPPPRSAFYLTFPFAGGTKPFHVYFLGWKRQEVQEPPRCCSPFIPRETRAGGWGMNCVCLCLGIKILTTNQRPQALLLWWGKCWPTSPPPPGPERVCGSYHRGRAPQRHFAFLLPDSTIMVKKRVKKAACGQA